MLPGLAIAPTAPAPKTEPAPQRPRVKAVNRAQAMRKLVEVEQLIGEDRPARAIWAFVGQLDLQPLHAPMETVEGGGRPSAVGSARTGLPVDFRLQPRARLGPGNGPALRV